VEISARRCLLGFHHRGTEITEKKEIRKEKRLYRLSSTTLPIMLSFYFLSLSFLYFLVSSQQTGGEFQKDTASCEVAISAMVG
jgi:hypothetical protein